MLYIYRASAGSGKTFLLTGFYIELLFRNELTPSREGKDLLFSEILAVTFTNKATAEMKERIILDLNTLWKKPSESQYYSKLKQPDSKGKTMSDGDISRRAHTILREMLTDYSSLHISTIDSFFQQVVRSFAHELNVQGNYEVELDADRVLEHAVSQFLLTLDPNSDQETFDWLLRFSNNRMANGSTWNVHAELVKLAKVLTTEEYRHFSQKVADFSSDKKQMSDYISMLDSIIRNWRKDLRKLGAEAVEIIKTSHLTAEDFNRGSIKPVYDWANGIEKYTDTIRKWAEDPKLWFSAKKAKEMESRLGPSAQRLQQILQDAEDLFVGERAFQYNSATSIRKNIYQLGLLSRLEQVANDYCAEQGIKLLSDTTQMLNALVDGQSSPFIYEKTGTRIASYMIDEFQDTSGMQWQNFSPLLRDSLGTNNRNLIVGDVKQSIYRWRGSDWELLHSKLNSFMPKMQAWDENHNQLRDNWRSDRKIIEFNNQFFRFASGHFKELEPDNDALDKIIDIYADVKQEISDNRIKMYREKKKLNDVPPGMVTFEILEGTEGSKEYTASVVERLPELVIALQQKGFEPKDILILCRKRSQCNICAKALLNYKIEHPESPYSMEIITQEALLLIKHPVVRALVAALEYLHDPKSAYCRTLAGISWQALASPSIAEAIVQYQTHPCIPAFENLINLPLYETVERLISWLPDAARQETSFIHAFCDVVLDFCSKEGPNLDSFLSWWHENGHKRSVTTPSDQNAISIMTIHKSKGLAGDAVIVPFAQENLDLKTKGMNPDLLWCEPQTEPFARPNLTLPIEITGKIQNSIFSSDYNEERIRAIIDNLNTAYVAFTRAKNALIILSPTLPKSGKGTTLQSFLNTFFEQEWKLGIDKIDIDANAQNEGIVQSDQDNQHADAVSVSRNATAQLPLIKQTDYVPTADSAAVRGTTLHAAFSAIQNSSQIDEAVIRLFSSGQAKLQGITLPEVLDYMHKALCHPQVSLWFDPANQVLNEQDIVTKSTHTQRPDRIVFTPDGRCIIIDYKTGVEHNAKYQKQVAYYMHLMQEMGFQRVEGYIWYIETGKILAVSYQKS